MPHRVAGAEASSELPRSSIGAGSPDRYYAPVAPFNARAALGALIAGWNGPATGASLIVAATSSAAGAAATAYMSEDERRPLLTGGTESTHLGSQPAPWPWPPSTTPGPSG